MARKYVLLDDYDGAELSDDTQPINLKLGRTTYALYLSDDNHTKLLEALTPFIEGAETVSATTAAVRTAAAPAKSADKAKMKRVRQWAQDTGFKFKGADGTERTLGDRGRIPQEVVDAYDEQNPDD